MDEKKMAMDKQAVMDVLPHRAPMLLIDEVTELKPMESIEATLYIDPNWELFKGHFPGAPVFPGVMSVECMAQAADIMLMTAEKYKGKTPLMAGITDTRFYKKVEPGAQVRASVKVKKENAEKAVITCRAELYLGDDLAAETVVTLAMR